MIPFKTLSIPWKHILSIFIALRVITLAAAVFGFYEIPFKYSFPLLNSIWLKYESPLIWSWANFDGMHYIMLARDGYTYGLTQAFFPGYIIAMRVFNVLVHNYLLSGLLVSHACFIGLLVMFYKLARLDYSETIARRALLFISLFPTSFFFLSVYTESLFLLLLLISFYLYRTGNKNMAFIGGIGVTMSRLTGIVLIPALWWELKQQSRKISIRSLLSILIPSIGLLLYMLYLYLKFNDPLMFVHVQNNFGAGRETGNLVLIYQVVWRYIKMILTVDKTNPIYFTVWLELVISLYALGLLIWAYIKKVRPSYLIFSFISFIIPTLTGTFSSMPRYVLVLFPIFIVLALIENKYLRYFIFSIHIILLFICTMLFTRGYWIA